MERRSGCCVTCLGLLAILKAAVCDKGGEGPLGFSRQGQPEATTLTFTIRRVLGEWEWEGVCKMAVVPKQTVFLWVVALTTALMEP